MQIKNRLFFALAFTLAFGVAAVANAQDGFSPALRNVSFDPPVATVATQDNPADNAAAPFSRESIAAAIQQEVKYLRLGEDPQNPGRMPGPGEILVVADDKVCDPAWGTRTGTVSGCYAPKTVYIATQELVVIAPLVCGNVPSQRHVVTGKVISLASAPALQEAILQEIKGTVVVTGIPTEIKGTVVVTGIPTEIIVRVIHGGTVEVVHRGSVDTNNKKGAKVGWWIGGGALAAGAIIKWVIIPLLHKDVYVPPGGKSTYPF